MIMLSLLIVLAIVTLHQYEDLSVYIETIRNDEIGDYEHHMRQENTQKVKVEGGTATQAV